MGMRLLATTPPGLEAVAAGEIRDLLGVDAERHHRGAVVFTADAGAVPTLNARARTLHRVLVLLAEGPIGGLSDAYELATRAPLTEHIAAGQAFAVRSSRHGEHDFTSVDVADRVGQGVIDAYREATGHRLPVDLDDPDVLLRAYVRDDRFVLGLDTTGERSLHRRWYRVHEHDAPLRPTIAAALLRLAGWTPTDSLLDPMCGSGTIPIEAALVGLGIPPAAGRETVGLRRLRGFDAGAYDTARTPDPDPAAGLSVSGSDVRDRWVGMARDHAAEAGVADAIEFTVADARERPFDADVVVANMPFGVRTERQGIEDLYRAVLANAFGPDATWDRLAVFTARPDLLDRDPDERLPVRYGRLDTEALVFRR